MRILKQILAISVVALPLAACGEGEGIRAWRPRAISERIRES